MVRSPKDHACAGEASTIASETIKTLINPFVRKPPRRAKAHEGVMLIFSPVIGIALLETVWPYQA